jgi:hypothetical protein
MSAPVFDREGNDLPPKVAIFNRLWLCGVFCLETAAMEGILGENPASNLSEKSQFPLQWVQEFEQGFAIICFVCRCQCKRVREKNLMSVHPHTDVFYEQYGEFIEKVVATSPRSDSAKVIKELKEQGSSFTRFSDKEDHVCATPFPDCECVMRV